MPSSVVTITVDVHCVIPTWAIMHPDENVHDSRYRIFVNSELLVERKWLWGNTKFIRESIVLRIDLENTHTLEIAPVIQTIPGQAVFTLHNFNIINQTMEIIDSSIDKVSFRLA